MLDRRAVALALLGVVGCVEGAPEAAAPIGDSVAAPSGGVVELTPGAAIVASYHVPVPLELMPFATYPLDDVAVTRTDDRVAIAFTLPVGLLGFAVPITFTGTVGGEVTGSGGDGTCRDDGGLVCDLRYYDFGVDVDAVAAYWRQRNDGFVVDRLRVTALFEADPLGVVRFTAR